MIIENLVLDEAIINSVIAAAIGIGMGIERAFYNKTASIRTFSLISLGSCVFTILSMSHIGPMSDPARIAAQIVSGVGFLGGGVILKNDNKIEGITTAAMIWFAAAIGMMCGFGFAEFALWIFLIYSTVLILGIILHAIVDSIVNRVKKKSPKLLQE